MIFSLKFKPQFQRQIIERCDRQKLPLPADFLKSTDLLTGLALYWDSFWTLESCRPSGWGLMPLPWTTVKDYGIYLDLDGDDLDDFIQLVRDMDNAYLEFFRAKKEQQDAIRKK